jgi:hypothetical protein
MPVLASDHDLGSTGVRACAAPSPNRDTLGVNMARPRIVEVDYFGFQQALRRATDSGNRIEQTDKPRWNAWVRANGVKEAAFKSFGEGKFDGLVPVILDGDAQWRGYYLVSTSEEACLKWERDDAAA